MNRYLGGGLALSTLLWSGTSFAAPLPPVFNPISPTTGFESSQTTRMLQNEWRYDQRDRADASSALTPEQLANPSNNVLQIEVDGQLLTPSQAQQLLLRQQQP
ncbi:hypothetical protein RYO59_002090 [Thermosynechococcaceae cyanobacterium Okahandja]